MKKNRKHDGAMVWASRRMLPALLLAALSGIMGQAHAASASANGTATVIVPMTITKTADLRFGTFAPTSASGSVSIDSGGARTGAAVALSSANQGGAASFSIAGDSNYAFAITLPTSATLTGPGTAMTLNDFTSNLGTTATLSGGTATLMLGGTLAVGANQVAGNYSGSFNVSVDYN